MTGEERIKCSHLEQCHDCMEIVRELEAKLCRAREALEEVRKEELQYGNICQETTMPLIEQALSSTGPCRHEKLADHLEHENKALERLHHNAVEERDRLKERLRLRYDTVEGMPTGQGEDEIDRLEAKLCRAREAWEKRKLILQAGNWDPMKMLDAEDDIKKALSSTGPCRHEEPYCQDGCGQAVNGSCPVHGGDACLITAQGLLDENKRLKEAVEWALDDTPSNKVEGTSDVYKLLCNEPWKYRAELRRRAFTTKDRGTGRK